MERGTLVYVELHGTPHLVGRLWMRVRGGRETATFQYDNQWLDRADRFALAPALTLDPAPHHTAGGKALFGALADSAPDRWGRALMRRAERMTARHADRTPRTLHELDYLLMVNDEARQGALRFAESEGGPFLASGSSAVIPPLVNLPQLLLASEQVEDQDDAGEQLRLLLAPGSSLGGARPKASVRDKDQQLAIAKFPHKNDDTSAVLWEAVALTLAQRAGIPVPTWRIEIVSGKPVLLLRRFDRIKSRRIPFLSAMSMIGAGDGETRSYLEFVDALRQHGAQPLEDMRGLWRRIVFNVLISNTDDHPRNHAFLYAGEPGWALSPAYDLNPVPIDVKPRVLSTMIDLGDPTASFELAMSVVAYFELEVDAARVIAREVARAVSDWREVAKQHGITANEAERMASAFEHRDMNEALAR